MRLCRVISTFLWALCVACSSGPSEGPLVRSSFGEFDAAAGLPDLGSVRERRGSDSDNYLVQFKHPIDIAQRSAVLATGAQIIRYFPDHAYIVRATSTQAKTLGAVRGVHAVNLFPDTWRLSPALVDDVTNPAGGASRSAPVPVLVEYLSPAAAADVMADIQDVGGQVLRGPRHPTGGRVLVAILTPEQMAALLRNLDVLAIEPYAPMQLLNDVEYGILQAGVPNTSPIWSENLTGQGQVIGIADGDLGQQSCRFTGSSYVKVVGYVQESNTPTTDPNMFTHGTHVAGIALGDNLNNQTFDDQDGMAPGAQMYFQALGDNLAGVPADLGQLFQPALTANAFIHSNSWGGALSTYDASARSVDAFVADNPAFLPIFSAGNSGFSQYTISDPGTAKNVITVGSMDDPNNVSFFSSHGPTTDGRIKPTLIATGGNVISAYWSNPAPGNLCATTTLSGTSMAAPNIAGAAALVREYYTEGFYPTGQANTLNKYTYPSAALMRATLIASGVNMDGNYTDGPFPATGQGFGRAQLDTALYFSGGATQRLWVQDAVTTTTAVPAGGMKSFVVHVQYNTPLKIVLTWTDAAPAANANTALVNNLDLAVIDPVATLYKGNVLSNGNSVIGGTADAVNVEEMVYFAQPTTGTYTIRVSGTNVPSGTQTFALVAVGSFQNSDMTALTNSGMPAGNPGGSSGGGTTAGGAGGGGGSASGVGGGGSASGVGGGGGGTDQGVGTADYGIDNKSGCNAVAANDALLVLLLALLYLMPKPPRRRRVRIKR